MKKKLLKNAYGVRYFIFYLSCLLLVFLSQVATAHNYLTSNFNDFVRISNSRLLIKGKVIDAKSGETIPGVSVLVKGTKTATVTDSNGSFQIDAPENATLIFTSVGFEITEVPINGKTNLTIKLNSANKNLDEVVVIGYGTAKKTSLTAAVSTVAVTDITQKPVVNITNALVGRASGLIATQSGGEPGFDGSGLLIRGPATVGRTAPLTVVDGVPRDFSRLDPNSIATITILKDAAAVAPYGVAGANGVILITTKSGTIGKPTLSYNGYLGFQNPTSVPRFVNSFQYATLRNEAAANDGTAAPYTARDLELYQNHQDPDGHADAYPLEEIIQKDSPIQYHNLSLSGGSEGIQYFASFGYNRQEGMWSTTFLNKYAGSVGLTADVTKTTKVNLKVVSYQENQNYPSQSAGTIIGQAQRQNPTFPVRYTNGLASGYIGQSLAGEIYDSGYALNKNFALLTQLSVDQQLPIKGLSIKGVVSYDSGPDPLGFSGNQTSVTRRYVTPIKFTNPVAPNNVFGPGIEYTYPISIQGSQKASFSQGFAENKSLTLQGLLNYSASFGKSEVEGVLVSEFRNVKWQNFTANRINYNLDIDELNFGGPLPTDVSVSGSSGGQKQLGYVYRLGYTYNKRYTIQASGRYDGSYVFAPGKRFGFFPAFSGLWRISEENFIKDIAWVDNLKLRGSYGQSGNYPDGGQYQYLSAFGAYANSAVIGGSATQGISENLQGNPDITWEKARKTDIGLEGSIFKGLFGFEVDFFYERRSNFLVDIGNSLPGEYGVGVGRINGGIVSNKGVDLTLTSYKNFSNGLRLDVKGTFTFAKSKRIQIFENAATFNNPNRRRTGTPLGQQFGLRAIGYYTPDDFVDPSIQNPVLKPSVAVPNFGKILHPGDLKYADLSGPDGVPDGKVDANDETNIGNPQTPQIIYGLEPRLSFKNFDLDLLFQGSARSSIGLSNYYVFPFLGSGSGTELYFQDHWTPETPNARYPRISGTPSSNNTQFSSWYLRNDSYVRLKSAELGYTFSKKTLGNVLNSVRVYASGQNIFFWTPGMKEKIDPENSGSNQNYYQQRVISFGLNVGF